MSCHGGGDDRVSIPSQLGTLFGDRYADFDFHAHWSQYPRSWALSSEKRKCEFAAGAAQSQYPRSWALSSEHTMPDGRGVPFCLNTLAVGHSLRRRTFWPSRRYKKVSIPSQLGTLFGDYHVHRYVSRDLVSIPSQLGTLFGGDVRDLARIRKYVSIPSQLGTLFGVGLKALLRTALTGLNTLAVGHSLRSCK